MKSQSHSSIRDHCSHCNLDDCSSRNFRILATGNSELELLVKERLLINRRKPVLNGKIDLKIDLSRVDMFVLYSVECIVFIVVYCFEFISQCCK